MSVAATVPSRQKLDNLAIKADGIVSSYGALVFETQH
jgi:hypothetical protein